ncbi:MAG: STAS domain-containing protein [Actinomycetota bacterium]
MAGEGRERATDDTQMESQLGVVETDNPLGLRLVGEADLATEEQLVKAVAAVAGRREPNQDLHLDLSELSFIDCCSIRAICQVSSTFENGSKLVITPSPAVRRIVSILDLEGEPYLQMEGEAP